MNVSVTHENHFCHIREQVQTLQSVQHHIEFMNVLLQKTPPLPVTSSRQILVEHVGVEGERE